MTTMTTGAPMMDVTVLIDISFGANITLAIRSENIQKKALEAQTNKRRNW